MPSLELQEGTFTSCETEGTTEFFKKMGVPTSSAETYKGTTMRFSNTLVGDRWVTYYTMPENPSFSGMVSFVEGGLENDVDSPLFFGKAKVSFKAIADNTCHTIIKTANFGTLDLIEKYSMEGVNYSYKHLESGATFEVFCPRVFDNDGWYKMTKVENYEAYNKAIGMPCFKLTSYWYKHQRNGNVINMVDLVNGSRDECFLPLDEEVEHTFVIEGTGIEMTRKMLITQLAPNKYICLTTSPEGRKERWTTTFDTKGNCVIAAFDCLSKKTCTYHFKKCAPFCGVYKFVSLEGFERQGAAMGMPPAMIDKMVNDFDARLTLSEKDGYVCSNYESKVFPFNVRYKWDEEFTMTLPGLGTYRCTESLKGSTFTSVSKGPKFTTHSVGYLTDNFLVQENHILGTDIKSKQIMERIQ